MTHLTDQMLPCLYEVTRRKRETTDTFTLDLQPAGDDILPPFRAGQFNMMYAFGVGEVPISISGDPAKPEKLRHTVRIVGAVSRAIARLKSGMMIGLRGPYGSCWPVEAAVGDDIILVAGGIGLAPLRPALYEILANRDKYGKVILFYGARSPEELLFRKELERWRSRFDMEVLVTVDRALPGWHGNVGVVTTLIPRINFDAQHATAMICGPEVMMRYTIQALQTAGVGLDQIHISMERNMKCAIGFCGHCQFGPLFICKDGPVFRFDKVEDLFYIREI